MLYFYWCGVGLMCGGASFWDKDYLTNRYCHCGTAGEIP